jgi:N-acetylglucosaminyldiphosphoundecaprenol N-acetyl-beta-D-mannosaminyltransferase
MSTSTVEQRPELKFTIVQSPEPLALEQEYSAERHSSCRITLVGLPIDNVTMTAAVARIVAAAQTAQAPRQVAFVNADCVNIAFRNSRYARVLRRASQVFADGVGMKIAGRVLHRPVVDNVNGTDLFPELCAALSDTGLSLYLLGGRPGVPEGVAEWIVARYPQVQVAGLRHGYFTPAEEPEVIRAVAESRAEILLVAFGEPRQSLWIADHLAALKTPVAIGVGGLFDFISGRVPRAPLAVRRLGLEWAYRMYQEPGRLWRRYLIGNTVFLARLARVWWHRRRRLRS